MTFGEKKKEPVKCSTYHGLNKEYPCICEAQGFEQLKAFGDAHGISLKGLLRSEWEKLYKTYPTDGGCWLVQNPALITLQMAAGLDTVKRKPGTLFKTAAALKKQLEDLEEKPKEKKREAFPDPDDYQFEMIGEL